MGNYKTLHVIGNATYECKRDGCDGTGPADESKRTKRVRAWSRQNWLGGYTHCCFLVQGVPKVLGTF